MTTHLDVLNHRLSTERVRLQNARTPGEKNLRTVWIAQIEREIAQEVKMVDLLGAHAPAEMTDDELLAELTSE